MKSIWSFFTTYLLIPLIGILFFGFIILMSLAPERNKLHYYEIKDWGKFVCSTDYTWGNKVVNKECWLLEMQNEMKDFIDNSYCKTKYGH